MKRLGKAMKNLLLAGAGTAAVYGMMKAVAKRQAEDEGIDDDNPYLTGEFATGENRTSRTGKQNRETGIYESKVKPIFDQILSFGALIVLAPLYVAIALAIKIDDPGPAIFTQKRVGKDKRFFYCHKFRTMKMCTPHDVPTHQLSDPDRYITRVGRFLRRMSLDELPQAWDIFRREMSLIGPRPALWNQDDLVAERDRYGANDVLPGLTGWAQINGRDELEIPEKARLDGEYVRKLKQGGWKALFFDARCFIGTIFSVAQSKGVVEGGTGELRRKEPATSAQQNLWIFHHYATTPDQNGHIRPFRFAKHLERNGIRTIIFASSYHHWADMNVIEDGAAYKIEVADGVEYVFVRTPSSAPSSIARVKNMLAYARGVEKIAENIGNRLGKPDVILASSPHPLAMIAGIRVARKQGIPCICEVRDLWPDAIFMGGRLSEKSLMGKALVAGEHWIYKNADALIFTKEGDTDYLHEKKWMMTQGGNINPEKCFYINNGVELPLYDKQAKTEIFEDKDLEDDSFKVVYTGAIRPVNDVENIVNAAKLLPKDGKIRILIYGDGNLRKALERKVIDEKIDHVKFKGFVDKRFIPYILSKSSVNLLNYSSSNYTWSRGNSSNKLFEYLASGKPVIATIKTGYSIIQKYDCGLEMEKESPEELARDIMRVKEMDQERYEELCNNARRAAHEFDYGKLSARLLEVIQWVNA